MSMFCIFFSANQFLHVLVPYAYCLVRRSRKKCGCKVLWPDCVREELFHNRRKEEGDSCEQNNTVRKFNPTNGCQQNHVEARVPSPECDLERECDRGFPHPILVRTTSSVKISIETLFKVQSIRIVQVHCPSFFLKTTKYLLGLRCSINYFLSAPFCSMNRLWPAPSDHLGCWLIRLEGLLDPRMHRCVARTITMLILDFMKFEIGHFLISW